VWQQLQLLYSCTALRPWEWEFCFLVSAFTVHHSYWCRLCCISAAPLHSSDWLPPLLPAYITDLHPHATHSNPDDGGSMFLQNTGIHLQYYTTLQPGTTKSKLIITQQISLHHNTTLTFCNYKLNVIVAIYYSKVTINMLVFIIF
jgi:hypothetical protein